MRKRGRERDLVNLYMSRDERRQQADLELVKTKGQYVVSLLD